MLVSYYITTWHRDPEDLDIHRRESLIPGLILVVCPFGHISL